MLLYFDEYKDYLSANKSKEVTKTILRRLSKLNQAEKSLLEMSSDEIFDAIEADKKAKTTLYGTVVSIENYLKWLTIVYNIPVYDCYYEVKIFKKKAQNYSNTGKNYFADYAELLNSLLEAERNYLKQTETLGFSEKKIDGIIIKQKMFNAYVTLMWKQLTNDEMLALTTQDVSLLIEAKQILFNGRIIYFTEQETEVLQVALDNVKELHNDIEEKIERAWRKKRRIKLQVYNNLFNTESVNVLTNLRWSSIGSSSTDFRLQLPNILKAGIFSKMKQYEIENDCSLGQKDVKNCAEMLNVSETTVQRYIVEYGNFKQYQQEFSSTRK